MCDLDKRSFSESEKEAFRRYADAHAPKSSLVRDCVSAFVSGGVVCMLGEAIGTLSKSMGVSEENVKAVIPVSLIFLSCLLTSFGVFDKIAKHAKAGVLVPITGFANAVCSCAIDAKSEGFILGVGAKMFVIAGPVIVYGTLSSVVWGIIYYLTSI